MSRGTFAFVAGRSWVQRRPIEPAESRAAGWFTPRERVAAMRRGRSRCLQPAFPRASVDSVVSPARIWAASTGGVAIVGTVGSGLGWVNGHVSAVWAFAIATVLGGISMYVIARIVLGKGRVAQRYKYWHFWLFLLVEVITLGVVAALLPPYTTERQWDFSMAFALAAFAIAPLLLLSYQVDDTNHKQCSMCCERIKEPARVCRHCGSRQDEEGVVSEATGGS